MAEQGVWYPHALSSASGSPCHRLLAVFAMDFADADDAFKANHLSTAALHREFANNVAKRFEKEVAAKSTLKRWLISSEHLHSRLPTVEKVARVKHFLAPYFEKITVYVHLRPQIDMAVSLASTGARTGVVVGPKSINKVSENLSYYNYFDLVDRWAQVFDPQNLVVIPYRRQPDFRAVISLALGLDSYNFTSVDPINTGLDWQVIAMLNQLQRDNRKKLAERLVKTGVIETLPKQEPLRVGLEMAKNVQSRFADSNARLIARIDTLKSGDLDPDWARYQAPANIEQLNKEMIIPEPVLTLISNMASMYLQERITQFFTSAERATARGNLVHAKDFVARAVRLIGELDPDLDDPKVISTLTKRAKRLERK